MTDTVAEKPCFRKGQTVWRQRHGKIEEGQIYQVARVTFRSQGYDDDPNGKDFMYRAKFDGSVGFDRADEQASDGELWDSTFTANKREAYRKLTEAARKEILKGIEKLSEWAEIEKAAADFRDYKPRDNKR